MLARGMNRTAAAIEIGQVVEGEAACSAACRLASEFEVDMPICQQVYRVVYEGLDPTAAVRDLLSRQPRTEA